MEARLRNSIDDDNEDDQEDDDDEEEEEGEDDNDYDHDDLASSVNRLAIERTEPCKLHAQTEV